MSVIICSQCKNQVEGSLSVCIYCGTPISLSSKAVKKTVGLIVIVATMALVAMVGVYQFAKSYLPDENQFPQSGDSQSNSGNPESPDPSLAPDSGDSEDVDPVAKSIAIEKVEQLLAEGICSKESTAAEFFENSEFPDLSRSDWDQGFVRQCQSPTTASSVRHWVTIFGPELISSHGKSLAVPVNSILVEGDGWFLRSNYYGEDNPRNSSDQVVTQILSLLGGRYTLN